MANKTTKAIAVLIVLALALSLIVGCAADPDAASNSTSSGNAVLEATSSDDGSTVENSPASSADESNGSEEPSAGDDESSIVSEDESEPAEESSAPSEQSKPETSKTETSSSEPSKETSKDDETSKENPSNTGSSHKHSYTETVVKPTCTEKGYTLHTCSCGDNYKDNETAKVDHDFSNPSKYTEPTETTRGKLIATCAYGCGTSVSEEYYSNNEVVEMLRPRVLYWINYYRKEAGVSEAAISKVFNPYAQYRATQLVTNYAHDMKDMRAAAAATHVGTLYESAQASPETGWQPIPGEIISSGQAPRAAKFSTTDNTVPERIDGYAKRIVDAFYNSSSHKRIMLMEENEQIIVGIGSYQGYVCITFTTKRDEKSYNYWYEDADGNLYHAWVSYETGYFSDDNKNFIYPPSEKYNEVFLIQKAEDYVGF